MNNRVAILRKFNRRKGKVIGGVSGTLSKLLGTFTISAKSNEHPLSSHGVLPDVVLNWGNSYEPFWLASYITSGGIVINHPKNIHNSVDKIETFRRFAIQGIKCVENTTVTGIAKEWLNKGHKVFCRTKANSSRGKGIIIAESANDLIDSPLYTKGFNKNTEYRLHVFNGKVIFRQEKRRRSKKKLKELGLTLSKDIFNIKGGYVFCMKEVVKSIEMEQEAIKAVSILGLDFAAVDVLAIKDEDTNTIKDFSICEVNTSPMLSGNLLKTFMATLETL